MMFISNMKAAEKDRLDNNFHDFMTKLMRVAKYKPKEKYLYPIMKGVAFRDLEVALDMAALEKSRTNDNGE